MARHTKIVAPMVLQGAMNAEMFLAYVEQCLVPTLKRHDIVVMDNVSTHKSPRIVRQSRMHGRPFATCPSIRPTSIPLRWPSANSEHFCARPPSEPFRAFGERFAHSCHASVLKNVPITSDGRDMLQYEQETL